MLKNWIIWLIIVFSLVIVFIVCGCEYDSPNARYTDHIQTYHVGTNKCDIVHVDSEGRVIFAIAKSAACYAYADGTPSGVGGMKFDVLNSFSQSLSYDPMWFDTDKAETSGSPSTGDSGYAVFGHYCEIWDVWQTNTGTVLAKPHDHSIYESVGATFVNRRDIRNLSLLAPWYEYKYYDGIGWNVGGEYFSETNYATGGSIDEEATRGPVSNASGNLSESDSDFLVNESLSVSDLTIYDSAWCKRSGRPGCGFSEETTDIVPLNHCNEETIAFRSTPYFLSLQIALAEPVDREDVFSLLIPAILSAGSDVNEVIYFRAIAVSDDQKRLIVQSDYIVPVESGVYDRIESVSMVYDRWSPGDGPNDPEVNIYVEPFYYADPNCTIDPNFVNDEFVNLKNLNENRFVPVYIVPLAEGEHLKIRFNLTNESVMLLSGYWLSSNDNFDINNDGIVNLQDLIQ